MCFWTKNFIFKFFIFNNLKGYCMKIQNNFFKYNLQQPKFCSKIQNNQNLNQNNVSYYEAHKVLSDSLVLDSMAIALSDVIANFKENICKIIVYP